MTTTTKQYKGLAMEGPIASWYAGVTRSRQSEYEAAVRTLTAHLPAGGAVLEVAPGPGYLSIHLAQLGRYTVTGLDISRSFVAMARRNAREAGVTVDFRHGSASQMPFEGDRFDGLMCQAAFKNFADPVGALNEMHRVLKPGGRGFVLDMRGDVSDAELDEAARQMRLGSLNRLMVKWTFKHMLVKQAYTPASFRQLVARSRFGRCEIEPDGIGMIVKLVK